MPGRRLFSLAGKMAYRDVRANPAKFLATVVFMMLAAGGVFAARGITAGFKTHLVDEAREWIAADAAVVYFGSAPTEEQWTAIRGLAPGIRATLVTEGGVLVTSRAAADPATVALKAVEPAVYPFYGRLGLGSGQPLDQVLDSSSAIISPDLKDMLGVRVGDTIYIRGAAFLVRDVLISEPDRFMPAQIQSARVIISQDGLDRTGLFRFSPAYQRLLIRTPREADNTPLLVKLEGFFPQAEVVDHSAPTPQFTAALEGLLPFLDVLAFLTLLAASIAIAAATYFHLLARLDTIAMLKAVGATSAQIMSIYWFQMLLAAATGVGLGIAAGRALESGIVTLVGRFLDIHLRAEAGGGMAAETLALCLLAAMAAPCLPLMRIRHVSAFRLQRRDTGEKVADEAGSARGKGWKVVLGAAVAVFVLLFARIVQTPPARLYFSLAFCALIGALTLFASFPAPQSLLQRLRRAPYWIPWPVRQGLTNLIRYRRQSSLVMLALAAGTTLTIAAAAGEQQFARGIEAVIPFQLPDLLLVNVSESQRLPLSRFLAGQRGVASPPAFVPTSYLTLVSAGGQTLSELRVHRRAWIQRAWEATCLSRQPEPVRILNGRWWEASAPKNTVALDHDIAASLGVGVGSKMEFLSEGRLLTLWVAALVQIPPADQIWGHGIFLNCDELKPAAYNGGIKVDPKELPRLRRALHDRFPDVTTMLVKEFLERIERLGVEGARALEVVAALAICIAASLLIAVIHSVRAFRLQEIAILRAFGARTRLVLSMFAVEYLTLGLLAGLFGAGAGCATLIAVNRELTGSLKVGFSFHHVVFAVVSVAFLAAVVGTACALPLLRERPLDILRRH